MRSDIETKRMELRSNSIENVFENGDAVLEICRGNEKNYIFSKAQILTVGINVVRKLMSIDVVPHGAATTTLGNALKGIEGV